MQGVGRRAVGGGLLAALIGVSALALPARLAAQTDAPATPSALPAPAALKPALGLVSAQPMAATSPETTGSLPDSATSRTADVNTLAARDSQAELEEIEQSITISKDRAEELKLEIEEMKGDRAQQNAALIAAGQRVKMAEADIAELEGKLDDLIVNEMEVRGRLDGADNNIANVLAALERISRDPPPALMVNPTDALASARGAMLISAILPQLQARADTVTADLKRLTDIKAAALAEEEQLKANYQILEEEQLRIATLIVAKKQGEQVITAELAAEEASAEELAAKAKSLKELIASLTKRANAVAVATEATRKANAGATPPPLDDQTIRVALANTSRTQPAVPFSSARGFLTLPASGVNVIDYGAGDGFGGISQGISIVTRAEAQVVAPADGWVLYAGNYLNYGQIIILNAGQDYTVLLAGLDKVSVDIGQFVLMGEPVGQMGSRTIGRTVTTSAGVSRPTLYIEMRKNNEPLDPTGWWATPNPTATAANTSQSG
jgi:septal ring factor EnvC (AmiA/AmiB activator)